MLLSRSAHLALGMSVVTSVTGLLVAACSAKHDPAPGEIFLAIDANLKVPDDISELGVSVEAQNGNVASINRVFPMEPAGDTQFPATLAIVRGTSGPVDIKVAAFKNGTAFLLREAVTTIPEDRTAILRIDLNWLDEGSTSGTSTSVQSLTTSPVCASGQTSINGTCQSFMLDSLTLPTYAAGAVAASDQNEDAGSDQCLDIIDCMVGQPGNSLAGAISVAPPTLTTVPGSDGGVSASCIVAVSGISPPFNIGMVPTSNAAGWCNANGCVLPLESDAPGGGWTPDANGNLQLPLGVCTSTKIRSLTFAEVTPGCPQFAAAEHPACQDYGRDGGLGGGNGGGVRDEAGSGEGGGAKPILVRGEGNLGGATGPVFGLAIDPSTGVAYTFRDSDDGGATAVTYEQVNPATDPPTFLGTYPTAFFPPLDMTATSFAAGVDRVAASSATGVQAFFLDGGAVGPYGTLANAAVAYLPVDGGAPFLVAAGASGALQMVDPATNIPLPVSGINDAARLLASDGSGGFIVVTGTNAPQSLNYVTVASGVASVPPSPFAQSAQVKAVAFADKQTAVWVDVNDKFFFASVGAGDAGTGTPIATTTTLAGAQTLASSTSGRIAWINDKDKHVYTMRLAGGKALSQPTDLQAILGTTIFANATQVGIADATQVLYWIDDGSQPATLEAVRLSDLP